MSYDNLYPCFQGSGIPFWYSCIFEIISITISKMAAIIVPILMISKHTNTINHVQSLFICHYITIIISDYWYWYFRDIIYLTSVLKCTNEITQNVQYAIIVNIDRFIIDCYSLVNEVLKNNTIVRKGFTVVFISLISSLLGKLKFATLYLGKVPQIQHGRQ